jgi:hypothetical protein
VRTSGERVRKKRLRRFFLFDDACATEAPEVVVGWNVDWRCGKREVRRRDGGSSRLIVANEGRGRRDESSMDEVVMARRRVMLVDATDKSRDGVAVCNGGRCFYLKVREG